MTIHSFPVKGTTKEESPLSEPSSKQTNTLSNYLTGQLPAIELPLYLPPRLVTVASTSTSEILKEYFGGERPSTPTQDASDPRVVSRTNSSAVSSTHSLHPSGSAGVSTSQSQSVMTSVIHTQSRDQIRKELNQNYGFLIALKAAQKGSSEAQFNLGLMYERGIGVKQDYAQAVDWYHKAVKQDHAGAQCNLGMMYEKGLGVKEDYAQAVDWYRKAAEQSNAVAQFNLGWIYSNGKGVEANDVEAFNWYFKAAKNGYKSAQLELASAYQQGLGVKKDVLQATYWLLRSAVKGTNGEIVLDGGKVAKDFYSDVIQCIPAALTTFPEFSYKDFLSIGQMIRANPHLEVLNFEFQEIDDAQALILSQSLAFNTTLTELIFDEYDDEFSFDINIFNEIKASLAQNVVIAELREHMKNHPITRSDELPLEVLDIIVDNMIVAASKAGKSKETTIAAIDEFLLSASQQTLKNDFSVMSKHDEAT